jgi:hypothetical protein
VLLGRKQVNNFFKLIDSEFRFIAPNPLTIALKQDEEDSPQINYAGSVTVCLVDAKDGSKVSKSPKQSNLKGSLKKGLEKNRATFSLKANVTSSTKQFRLLFEVQYKGPEDAEFKVEMIYSKPFYIVSHTSTKKQLMKRNVLKELANNQ